MADETEKCMCFYCRMHRELAAAKASRDFDAVVNLAEQLGNRAITVESDLDYYKSILNGSWPNARDILTKAIERTKK